MLHQGFLQNVDLFTQESSANHVSPRLLLQSIICGSHLLFTTSDHPNKVLRLLVELFTFGASQDQLAIAYQRNVADLESIRIVPTKNEITSNNWKEYLGDSRFYKEYLMFFDSELQSLGTEETLERYFHSISPSMGAQLQPVVQLAFGVEQNLPELISQALAYYSVSYLDVSEIVIAGRDNQELTAPLFPADHTLANTILFDFARADQRFDGKIKAHQNKLQSVIKVLLQSQQDLLKSYMQTWTGVSATAADRMEMLVFTALSLIKFSSRQLSDGTVEMDWFLTGGQLLESILAIGQFIHNKDRLNDWIHVQLLSTLCTFIVQGRPMNKEMAGCNSTATTIDVDEIVQYAFDDAKLMLTLSSVLKAQKLYPQHQDLCLELIQILNKFSKNGSWVKSGLGW